MVCHFVVFGAQLAREVGCRLVAVGTISSACEGVVVGIIPCLNVKWVCHTAAAAAAADQIFLSCFSVAPVCISMQLLFL